MPAGGRFMERASHLPLDVDSTTTQKPRTGRAYPDPWPVAGR